MSKDLTVEQVKIVLENASTSMHTCIGSDANLFPFLFYVG